MAPFDPVAATVGEDEYTGGAAQFVDAEGIGHGFPHYVDPHVHVSLPHDLRQHLVELVPANLVVLFRVIHKRRLLRHDQSRYANANQARQPPDARQSIR